MKTTIVRMNREGRVLLPKALRERFGLRGGDSLAIEVREDAIELRPQSAGRLKRVNGVLVFTGLESLKETSDLVEKSRNERIDGLARELVARG